LTGRDPLAFIVSAYLARRNLTKGQQAMAYAMVYPDSAVEVKRARQQRPQKLPGFLQSVSSRIAEVELFVAPSVAAPVLPV